MGFTIKQVKAKASDCKKTHRWARVRCEVKGDLFTYRIIGVGTKYVRLMDGQRLHLDRTAKEHHESLVIVLAFDSLVLSIIRTHRNKK